MSKITIPWKAYPMDRSGVKSLVKGEVELSTTFTKLDFIHEQVRVKVYNDRPELRSTAILIGKFQPAEKAA